MHIVKARDVASAYYGMSRVLLEYGKHVHGTTETNGTTEIENILIEIDNPMKNTFVPNRDKRLKYGLPVDYVLGEMLWSGTGDNSLRFIQQFSQFWNHLSEDGKTVNSAYGYIATKKFGFSQIQAIIDELKVHPNSRRATLNINVPRTPGTPSITDTKDEWCTMYLEFLLRDGQLDMTACMRSNDVWLGFPYDYTYFLYIQWLIAQGLGVRVGTYSHLANSFHVYDNHLDDLKNQVYGITDRIGDRPAENQDSLIDATIDFGHIRKFLEDLHKEFDPRQQLIQYLCHSNPKGVYALLDSFSKDHGFVFESKEDTDRDNADFLHNICSEKIGMEEFYEEAFKSHLLTPIDKVEMINSDTLTKEEHTKDYRNFVKKGLIKRCENMSIIRTNNPRLEVHTTQSASFV